MTAQPDFDRFLESWLADGPSELSDRAASRIVQAIDESQRGPAWLPRRETMNRMMVAAGSVAAIALVAVIGISLVAGGGIFGPGATPSSTPTPTPSPIPTPTQLPNRLTQADDIEPGRYFADVGGYRLTFTVPDSGWGATGDLVFQGEDSELAIFSFEGAVASLYRRACDSSGTDFDPGPSVDDLADALASLEDFEATTPADVTVSGYNGKRVAITVPTNVDVRSTDCDGGKYSLSGNRWYQAPGQTDEMRILDVDGERQVILVSQTPGTPADIAAQLEEMVASLEIEPT